MTKRVRLVLIVFVVLCISFKAANAQSFDQIAKNKEKYVGQKIFVPSVACYKDDEKKMVCLSSRHPMKIVIGNINPKGFLSEKIEGCGQVDAFEETQSCLFDIELIPKKIESQMAELLLHGRWTKGRVVVLEADWVFAISSAIKRGN